MPISLPTVRRLRRSLQIGTVVGLLVAVQMMVFQSMTGGPSATFEATLALSLLIGFAGALVGSGSAYVLFVWRAKRRKQP